MHKHSERIIHWQREWTSRIDGGGWEDYKHLGINNNYKIRLTDSQDGLINANHY